MRASLSSKPCAARFYYAAKTRLLGSVRMREIAALFTRDSL